MLLGFGGVVSLLALLLLIVVVGWGLLSYLRGTARAAEQGIDPGPHEHPDPGHVSGPNEERHDAGHVSGPQDR